MNKTKQQTIKVEKYLTKRKHTEWGQRSSKRRVGAGLCR